MKTIKLSIFATALMTSLFSHGNAQNYAGAEKRFDSLVQTCGDFSKVGWVVKIEDTESLAPAFDILAAEKWVKIVRISTNETNAGSKREIAFNYVQTHISLAEVVLQLEDLDGVSITCRRPSPGGFSSGN